MAGVGTGADVRIGTTMRWNVGEYTVIEDSTPVDPSDTSGGFGQITITLPIDNDTKRIMGSDLTLTDGSMGQIAGRVRGISGGSHSAQITANSRVGQLAVERSIQPFIGNLAAGLTYLLSLCGVVSGFTTEAWMSSLSVKLPGGRENVYDYIKRMGPAYGFEVSLVSSNIVFRAPRGRNAVNYRDAEPDWELSQEGLARSIQGYYYDSLTGNRMAYPRPNEIADAPVWQVDAGETQVYTVQIDASLSAVEQPTPKFSVPQLDTSLSQYSVVDSEGNIVDPGLWSSLGGSVLVEIGEDTRSLIVTLTGANIPELSPFRFGMPMPDEENRYYASVRILGTGIHWEKKLITMELGGDVDLAPDEVGTVVDSEFMESYDQLFHRMLKTAERYGTDRQTLRMTTGGINRLGETGSAVYPTIGDVQTLYPGATIGSIQSQLGPTIGDWNDELFATVANDFTNQAFGNVAGARVLYQGSYYRIRNATLRMHGIEYAAERDNTIGDVYRTGETIGQWNTRWTGKTIRDVNIAPIA